MKNKITTDKDNIAKFKKTGELYGKKIECNSCSTLITCFGSNLEGKIAKFGSIESLLEGFKCRSCVSASKPKKEKKVSVRFIKRKEKEAKKELPIPQVKQFVPRNVLLKDAPDLQDSMSASGACLRPDIFLNSGRKCDDCPYVQNCNATCKNLKYVAA
jgi:hypothetical protein